MCRGCRTCYQLPKGEAIEQDTATAARILVVEDDERTRALIVEVLSGAGYDVDAAADGVEALARAKDPPDLVVSDVQMPRLSGYEVCRQIRDRFGLDVGFVFLSGSRAEPYDRVAGLEMGADAYLVKPFEPEELLAHVRTLLRRLRSGLASGKSNANHGLTEREVLVFRLLAAGRDSRAIASELVITPATVDKHVERILRKLGVHSRAQAVAIAFREGVVTGAGL